MVVKWIFEDYWEAAAPPYSYTMAINPNDGGSPQVTKNMNVMANAGPNRMNLVQEGQSEVPTMDFSGIILDQAEYEAMEIWYDKRILIKITDDLGRQFYGIFNKWAPKRERRGGNFWYHTYDAEVSIVAYYNASGVRVYGRIL